MSDDLSQVTARLDALQAEVTALREELRAGRERMDLSMRGQGACPACACRKLLHAKRIRPQTKPLALACTKVLYKPLGEFEAYVCTACGLVEWYVPDLSGVEIDPESFEIVEKDTPPEGGPYR